MNSIRKIFPLVVLIMFQLLILALLNLSFNFPSNTFKTGTIVNFLLPINMLLICITFASIVVINTTFKGIEVEIENQIRLENLEQLKELLHTMRGQRHDFNHHLQTVYGFLSVNAYEEAKNYLEESLTEVYVTNEIIRSDNPGLNALFYVKSGKMERFGINFSVNIRTSINLPLKNSELNAIVGNLLDNAVQKLMNTPTDDPIIILEAYRRGKWFILTVKDNGSLINPLHIDKLFLPGFTTKKEGEGMGLFNVKQLVHKYGGHIHLKSEDEEGLTTFEVFLPQKGEENEHP